MNGVLHSAHFTSRTSWLALVLSALLLVIARGQSVVPSTESRQKTLHDAGEAWIPDNGDGTYRNPILHADYSDPDVIRLGDEYYLVASSFSHFPGLPILHSKDLVNWKIIGHAAERHPAEQFARPQHGMGIWAPSLRHRNGEFVIYFGDPDRGVFMTKAKEAAGPWAALKLVRKVTGWIDPCPFWDDDGKAYLVHAWANSRVGIKSILAINRMNEEGTEILDDGVVVFVGHAAHPTIEGPKLYKRNGYYYIFAPAGGVKHGWQTVLRSRNIFGPYEDRVVLQRGSTNVNGPHQGAWVQTESGEEWFVHFQDRGAYGRIVHLQPMRWEDDWPVIGSDADGNGIGEPVAVHGKPTVRSIVPLAVPQTSDEFDSFRLGFQWQWQANENPQWMSLDVRKGWLRLFAHGIPEGPMNLWDAGSLALQKLPAPRFVATASLDAKGLQVGDKSGVLVFGLDYSSVVIERTESGFRLCRIHCPDADKGSEEVVLAEVHNVPAEVVLRVAVRPEDAESVEPKVLCMFSYSVNGTTFQSLGGPFVAREGKWVGAKVGVYAVAKQSGRQGGFADVDWFRVTP